MYMRTQRVFFYYFKRHRKQNNHFSTTAVRRYRQVLLSEDFFFGSGKCQCEYTYISYILSLSLYIYIYISLILFRVLSDMRVEIRKQHSSVVAQIDAGRWSALTRTTYMVQVQQVRPSVNHFRVSRNAKESSQSLLSLQQPTRLQGHFNERYPPIYTSGGGL